MMPGLLPLTRRSARIWGSNPRQWFFYILIPLALIAPATIIWHDAFEVLLLQAADVKGESALSPAQHTVPGFTLTFTMFVLGTLAMRVSEERRTGVWRRFLVTPIWLPSILLSWTLTAYVLALTQSVVLFAFGRLAFGMEVGNYLGVLIMLAVFALVPVGFGLLVASASGNPSLQQMLATFVSVLFAALGGGLMPESLFPGWAGTVAALTPNYWALESLHDLMAQSKGLIDVLPAIAILAAYGMVPLVLGLAAFQRRGYA